MSFPESFPESFLTELTDRNDIVEVVSSYVRLSKRSGANLFGLCPFHSEKTPSFSVSPDKQIYHCFGCGKGGGVINFIMEIENLSFPEAVEFLARRVNMPVPEDTNDRESKKRARLLALNKDAARWFYEQLSTPGGAPARDYMQRRRIGKAVATNFGIGFAPESWDGLRGAMKAKGYSDFELFDAGLVRKGKNGGFYDVFRNRLMFPVIDVRGNVIGFSGRILGDGEPKYMNSPETMVFNKKKPQPVRAESGKKVQKRIYPPLGGQYRRGEPAPGGLRFGGGLARHLADAGAGEAHFALYQ